MAAAKAEMQLMSPLQISDPFGSFPHSPTMDNYPKLEEMMLLSNGAPQFLGAAGAPEGSGGNSNSSSSSGGGGGGGGSSNSSSSSAFNPQGEAGEQPYEHLTAGKLWPMPRASPLPHHPGIWSCPTAFVARPSPQQCSRVSGMQVGFPFLSSHPQGSMLEGCLGASTSTPILGVLSGAQRSQLLFWMESCGVAWVGGDGGGLVLTSQAAPPPPPERLA